MMTLHAMEIIRKTTSPLVDIVLPPTVLSAGWKEVVKRLRTNWTVTRFELLGLDDQLPMSDAKEAMLAINKILDPQPEMGFLSE